MIVFFPLHHVRYTSRVLIVWKKSDLDIILTPSNQWGGSVGGGVFKNYCIAHQSTRPCQSGAVPSVRCRSSDRREVSPTPCSMSGWQRARQALSGALQTAVGMKKLVWRQSPGCQVHHMKRFFSLPLFFSKNIRAAVIFETAITYSIAETWCLVFYLFIYIFFWRGGGEGGWRWAAWRRCRANSHLWEMRRCE